MSVGGTGFGIGSNVGAYFMTRAKDPFGLKLRFDRYFSRQEALGRTETTDLAANSYYKSWTQQYFLISTGVEWRQKMNSHWSYFEALLGYGLGVQGTIEWTSKDPSVNGGEIGSKRLPLENRFILMTGWGYRRAFHKDLSLVAGIRTFLPIGAPYGGALEGKMIVPIPLFLSIGVQYR
jgi:hypothetical protein